MTTLLDKAEGQYLMIYFLNLVAGMRISETVAIEIDRHVEPDCSIIYVRQQREKDVNALKPHLKTEAGLRDIDLPLTLRVSCVTLSGAGRLAFYFRPLTKRCLIRGTSTGTA
jgi:hypothetical protein